MSDRKRNFRAATFWGQVDKSRECWLWTGRQYKGYGTYSGTWAHRVAFVLAEGVEIPKGMEIDHLCRTTLCVNPSHLELVTPEENMLRVSISLTHCKHGHEFNEENTYYMPPRKRSGRRRCRACHRQATARYRSRRAAA